MSGHRSSYRWMTVLLDIFFEEYDRNTALLLLRDETERQTAMRALAPRLEAAGMPDGMLATGEGSSLFVAVLALRLKFSRQEALAKVQLNIAMREGTGRTGGWH
jgi:hypothetical protein